MMFWLSLEKGRSTIPDSTEFDGAKIHLRWRRAPLISYFAHHGGEQVSQLNRLEIEAAQNRELEVFGWASKGLSWEYVDSAVRLSEAFNASFPEN